MSSAGPVGRLLGVLAAASPPGARILELGTGAGVGLAWIVHGLGVRSDASVLSVDVDDSLLAATRSGGWPAWVELRCADGTDVVREHGPFDLIFADAVGGKLDGLDATITSLAPRGVLLVDDMDPALHTTDGLGVPLRAVRDALMSHGDLVVAEIAYSTHMILAVKREATR
jgi:demethylmenaquinone methyltransferase/2-methoxy-6-polyprenyl-1,4-benzoquinol methylase